MLKIGNAKMSIICHENGRGLSILDSVRGTRWSLDEETLVYGREKYNNMFTTRNNFQAMNPISAGITADNAITVTCRAGEATVEFVYSIMEDHIQVRLPFCESWDQIGYVSMPGSFIPGGEKMKLLLPIMQGMQWDGRGEPFEAVRGEAAHLGFTMPFIGYMGEYGGMLFTAETSDDLWWWFGKNTSGRYWASNVQISSIGSMRYERVGKIFLTDPEIVSITKAYRKKVIADGNFKSWEEKIAEKPILEKLFGSLMCYIGYCKDDVDYVDGCRKLKEYGFKNAFIYPVRFNMYYKDIKMGGQPAIDLPTRVLDEIKGLGYEIAPWSWLNEALNDGTERIHRMYLKDHNGSRVNGWVIDDQKWYLTCPSVFEDYQKYALDNVIPEITWDHFDVLACASLQECYATDHSGHMGRPLTRSDAREAIRKTFEADSKKGVAVSSENFNDAYAKYYDFGSVKAWPQYGHWPFHPVPLTMLVYHDSVIHSWWELHSYNVPWRCSNYWKHNFEYGGGKPRLMAAMDALYGCPPDVFPFGAQYGYNGNGNDTYLYKYRFEDPEVQVALKEALPVAKLHEKIGKLEMIDFKLLSEDGNVQQTVFADGTRVIANFGRETYGSIPGMGHSTARDVDSILPESWKAMK